MESGRKVAVQIGVFGLIAIAFVGILLYYSEARQNGWTPRLEGRLTNGEAYANSFNGTKHIEKTFTVQPDGEFVLETDVGDVRIDGGEGEELAVSVDAEGDSDDLRRFDVQFRQSDNRVEVHGVGEKRGWRFWDWNGMRVRYSIKIPRRFGVQVSTAGGDVQLRAVEGTVKIGTSGGDVRVEEAHGEIGAETSGGDIIVRQVVGNVRLETSGGDISVSGARGDVYAETSGGDIRISNVEGSVDAETSGGDIEVRAEGENKGMTLDTSGGDIVIYVPRGITATVDASTTGGDVECELEISTSGKIEDDELHGKINGGGELIKAETSGGDIYIRALE